MCSEGLFLVGPSWRPIRVESAQFDEQEEGVRSQSLSNNVNVFKFPTLVCDTNIS